MAKAVFFDIDGTLWDFCSRIPESTREAIRQLRRNGHLTFLCSGRSRAYIQDPDLLGLGFDGIISGGGTMIEYRGERIFYRKIPAGLAEYTVVTTRRYGFRPILEGWEYLYMDEQEFAQDEYGRKLKRDAPGRLRSIADYWGKWEISKLSCATDHADRDACFKAMEPWYDFCIHNQDVAEFLPKGYHKGTGILRICDLLQIDAADTIAFGDSVNDLGMFSAAGTAVAMGSGSDAAKEAADYVTDALHADGIWKACRHFRLI